ncbi:MAG TPA: ABC transporter permease [Candidatus Parcubacteria bacterium]|nr:ABC transporter permease [Candidatus Parcubacteria bacterium]|tara:strand:- start:9187 stop:10425 length:1239 start_codon:yes stop_codon:yes gene_type:complete
MTFNDSFITAIGGLKTNKSRSALTILGIVIGICAIILVMSTGKSAEDLILNQIRGLGSQTIFVDPGKEPQGPSDFGEIFTDSLNQKDIDALLKPSNVQGLKDLTPVVMQVMPVTFESEKIRTNIIGASDLIATIFDIFPNEGAFFTDDDIRQKASVAVIGSEVKKKLFGPSDALGEKIKVKGRTFRVVGVLEPKGQVSLFNVDDMVVVPYTTAQQYLIGINYFNEIIIQAESEDIVPRVVRDVKLTLRETHGIDDPDKDDFYITTQADAVERVQTIMSILSILLVSVTAISLIVGGIGIMNIMLVSVSERTREIGLRKALGATEDDIMTQFLLEAMVLTALGGIIGIVLGALFSFLASLILSKIITFGWIFTFPVIAALLGFGVATLVGLVFGLYPARQASLKSPMEALRYE